MLRLDTYWRLRQRREEKQKQKELKVKKSINLIVFIGSLSVPYVASLVEQEQTTNILVDGH